MVLLVAWRVIEHHKVYIMGATKSKILKRTNPALEWMVVSELGKGSYGKVQLVKNKENASKLAAAKVAQLKDEESLTDYMTEITILATLSHPGITNFVDAFFFDNMLWILIEACYTSFNIILKKAGTGMTEPEVSAASSQMLMGLDYLHQNLVIHRDINSSNTLLAEGGLVKIADFGVSAMLKSDDQKRSTFIGSPNWMAPEVIACEANKDKAKKFTYSFKSDVWSFAITLIEFAEMNAPNHDLHPIKVMSRIRGGPPPTLSEPEKWSPLFNDFLKVALIKDPADRPLPSVLLRHDFSKEQRGKGNAPLLRLAPFT